MPIALAKAYYSLCNVSNFAIAKGFDNSEQQQTRIERVGNCILAFQQYFADAVACNIKNPLCITATTLFSCLVITAGFYPDQFLRALPFLYQIKPWMVKLSIYITIQTIIFGLGVRTYGRFDHPDLYANWKSGTIQAHLPGDVHLAFRQPLRT
ncbi:MAG: hypothetical protein H7A40_00775 [Chlamydiales bacterium]|nr:hypothetical protein [Chlamydiales bacterium]